MEGKSASIKSSSECIQSSNAISFSSCILALVSQARPERPIEAMVRRFQFRCVKMIERIARRIRPKRGHRGSACSTRRRQQQRDQIGRTLEQAIEPVIRFQGSPSGTAKASNADHLIVHQYTLLSPARDRAAPSPRSTLPSEPSSTIRAICRPRPGQQSSDLNRREITQPLQDY